MRGTGRLALAAACTLLCAAPASACAVSMNAFNGLGDIHVGFPRFSAPDEYSVPQAGAHQVGDVDGDGLADIAMSISNARSPGSAWVIFNPGPTGGAHEVTDPDWQGLRIDAPDPLTGVAGVGDINHDGFADVAVSTNRAVYIVFGRAAAGRIDAANLGDHGITLTGITPCPGLQRSSSVVRIDDGVAVCSDSAIVAFHPPSDAAGRTFDLGAPSHETGRLTLPGEYTPVFGAQPDGRIVVALASAGTVRVATMSPPAAGSTTTLADAEAAPDAAVLEGPAVNLEQVTPMSDANGDGRRDLAMSIVVGQDRQRFVAFTPAPGRHETLSAANTQPADDRFSGITDVGDQDGDGRPDLAYGPLVKLGSGGSMQLDDPHPTCIPTGPHTAYCGLDYTVVDTLPDMNGDGKPEMVAIAGDPLPFEAGDAHVTWRLDVLFSAPAPTLAGIDAPVQDGSGITFGGAFVTAPNGPIRTLGAQATLTITGRSGFTMTIPGDEVYAGMGTTHVAVRVQPYQALLLKPGETYDYRLSLETGRGMSATTSTEHFVMRKPYRAPAPGARGAQLTGTRRADRLVGSPFADVLRGGAGNDTLIGGRGNDRLDGGSGRDVLRGGPGDDHLDGGSGSDLLDGGSGHDVLRGGVGNDRLLAADGSRDVVDCGPGHDRATVDRHDRVRGCERVVRRRR